MQANQETVSQLRQDKYQAFVQQVKELTDNIDVISQKQKERQQLADRQFYQAVKIIKEGDLLRGALALFKARKMGSDYASDIFHQRSHLSDWVKPKVRLDMKPGSKSFELALCYILGLGVDKSTDKALSILESLNYHSNADMLFLLGEISSLKMGKGICSENSLIFFKRAASLGSRLGKSMLIYYHCFYETARTVKSDTLAREACLTPAKDGYRREIGWLANMLIPSFQFDELEVLPSHIKEVIIKLLHCSAFAGSINDAEELSSWYDEEENFPESYRYCFLAYRNSVKRKCQHEISKYESRIRQYHPTVDMTETLERQIRYMKKAFDSVRQDNIQVLCGALNIFKKPSDFLNLLEVELKFYGQNSYFKKALFNKVVAWLNPASPAAELSVEEDINLVEMILNIVTHEFQQAKAVYKEPPLKSIAHWLNLIFEYMLDDHWLKRFEIEERHQYICHELLAALIATDNSQNRQRYLPLLAKMAYHLPVEDWFDEPIPFWQEGRNIVRVLSLFYSQDQYAPMVPPHYSLEPEKLQLLLNYARLKPVVLPSSEPLSLDGDMMSQGDIDKLGLHMLHIDGGELIDMTAVKKEVKALLLSFTASKTSPFFTAVSLRENPTREQTKIQKLQRILKASESYNVLIELLALNQLFIPGQNENLETLDKLDSAILALLKRFGFKHPQIELQSALTIEATSEEKEEEEADLLGHSYR